MIRVSLTDNFSTLDRLLMVLERDQMPFAIARALTDMAQLGKATITREIPAIFSKGGPPKPFTVNSVVARPASKSTLAAEVFIKDTQAAYLQLEETGGTRSPRGAALVLPGSSLRRHCTTRTATCPRVCCASCARPRGRPVPTPSGRVACHARSVLGERVARSTCPANRSGIRASSTSRGMARMGVALAATTSGSLAATCAG